jgi:hypothetical protein
MQIFLNGLEYFSYRKIMKDVGVKYGCLNFGYLWARNPKFKIEDCDFLEKLIVVPGNITKFEIDEYIQFLNTNAEYISWALELETPDREMLKRWSECEVDVIPHFRYEDSGFYYITYADSKKPFVKARSKIASGFPEYDLIHGVEVTWPFLHSCSTSTWMQGSYIMSEFVNNKMQIYRGNSEAYAVSIGRKLINEGWDFNLLKLKRGDWREVAQVNCIAWLKYQEVMNEKI